MPRTKQRTPQLRARVVDAATALVAEQGLPALTARAVAAAADTSVAAVYELVGDKEALLGAVVIEGFRRLDAAMAAVATTDAPDADVLALFAAFRRFARAEPRLARLLFSRPVTSLAAAPEDLAVAVAARARVGAAVERCRAAGLVHGETDDVAHLLLALAFGLAAQEAAGWLGRGRAATDRRWDFAVRTALRGLAPVAP